MIDYPDTFDEIALWRRVPACREALTAGRSRSVAEFYEPLRARGQADRQAIAAAFKFDEGAYLDAYGDVRAAVEAGHALDGLDHWFMYGRHEERTGNRRSWRRPQFDRRYYLRAYPDVALLIKHGLYNTPEEHWVLAGQDEVVSGLRALPADFDEMAYLTSRPAVAEAVSAGHWTSGLDHWLSAGRLEARYSAPRAGQRAAASSKPASGPTDAQRQCWEANGFLVLPGALDLDRVAMLQAQLDDLWAERATLAYPMTTDVFLERPSARRIMLHEAPDEARYFPYKINDFFLFSELVRDIALDGQVTGTLRTLIGGDPAIINSLNFERGSQQGFHTDTLYMPGPIEGSMAAAWFALEDVSPEAGPLLYYPGSHKIPRFLFSNGRPNQINEEVPNYNAYMQAEIEARGLKAMEFLPKAGDVLIWHEHLYHGGGPIKDMSRTRESLVIHYWRANLMPPNEVRPAGQGGYFWNRPAMTP